ncbi:YggS family pyridoxal phosphate-dependent enzyme [Candidatus Pelagibacter sp.]|nr:YggS family pyridoxal phosphate-dependent enzyme [Candidatus Pelagibacter sp.]
MHETIKNLLNIEKKVKQKFHESNFDKVPNIIAVSKTFKIDHINPLIEHGHIHFGENKVQEAVDKWTVVKQKKTSLKLHLIGKLQTNKVKFAVKLFDYIHSLDNEKLAKKISEYQIKENRYLKLFIQINIGDENQKSGINENNLENFYNYCKDLSLNIVGLMCIPPFKEDSEKYFNKMEKLKNSLGLKELSMGMSSDYLNALNYGATYLRIGSSIFGNRN